MRPQQMEVDDSCIQSSPGSMQSHILQIPDDFFYGMSSLFTVGGK